MRFRMISAVLAMVVMIAAATPVGAQSQSDEWQFQISPLYLWAVSIDGSMTFRDRFDQDFAVDFADAFENLETVFTVHFEAGKGRWGCAAKPGPPPVVGGGGPIAWPS